MILARFGSVFEFNGDYYVRLGEPLEGDVLYAAKILDITKTNMLKDAEMRFAKRLKDPIHDSLTLCFVVLTTEDFKERAAYLDKTDSGASPSSNVNYIDKSLCEEDIKKLKHIILNDSAIPPKLKKIVEKLDRIE